MTYKRLSVLALVLIGPGVIILGMALCLFLRKEIQANSRQIQDFILSASERDIEEGNYFRISEALTVLMQDGQIACGVVLSRSGVLAEVPPDGKCTESEGRQESSGPRAILSWLGAGDALTIESPNNSDLQIFIRPKLHRGLLSSLVNLAYLSLTAMLAVVAIGLASVMIFRRRQRDSLSDLLDDLPKAERLGGLPKLIRDEFPELKPLWSRSAGELTKIQQAAAALETERELVQQANQIAHDIRSPLSALEIALHDLNQVPEAQRALARSAIARITGIANGLLEQGRQRFQLRYEECQLRPLLQELIAEKRLEYKGRPGIEIRFDGASQAATATATARVDATQLSRCLSNLINNAVEALPDQGQVIVRLNRAGSRAQVEIEDNGRGIPPEVLARLGTERMSYAKDEGPSGSGLGVWHARRTIEAFGGEFAISSELGRGTVVRIGFLGV